VRILEATGGAVEQVSEAEIAVSKAEIGEDGIGCEPASAATLAGLKKLVKQGLVKKAESVVLVLTGHVLKDSEYTFKFHQGELLKDAQAESITEAHRRPPIVLDGTVDAVLPILEAAGGGE
jgi:threonine synthase